MDYLEHAGLARLCRIAFPVGLLYAAAFRLMDRPLHAGLARLCRIALMQLLLPAGLLYAAALFARSARLAFDSYKFEEDWLSLFWFTASSALCGRYLLG